MSTGQPIDRRRSIDLDRSFAESPRAPEVKVRRKIDVADCGAAAQQPANATAAGGSHSLLGVVVILNRSVKF